MGSLYIVTGIMASGKSTIGELLAKQFEHGVHVRGDIFRRMVVHGREEMTANPTEEAFRQLNLRYDLGTYAAQRYQQAGFDVVLQDVMIGKVLGEVVARVEQRPLHVIVLCPDPKVVAKREAERGKIGYTGGFTPESMHRMMLEETARIGLWLDTTDMTAQETVEEILQRTARGEGSI